MPRRTAQNSYDEHSETIQNLLTRLQASLQQPNETPINWGDVGSLEHLAQQLQEACDQYFGEGEFACVC